MVRVYITSLIIPFLIGINKYFPGYQPPQIDPDKSKSLAFYRKSAYAVTAFIVMLVIATQAVLLYQGKSFSFFLVNIAAIVILAPLLLGLSDKFKFSNLAKDVLYIGTLFIVSAFCIGLDAGAIDRHRPYLQYRSGLARCEKFSVIRKIDDYYLAILPSSRKALIDDDCKIKIRFPLTKVDQ